MKKKSGSDKVIVGMYSSVIISVRRPVNYFSGVIFVGGERRLFL